MIVTIADIERLVLGSSFFACGGGVPLLSSLNVLSNLTRSVAIRLKKPSEFGRDDVLCTAYAIGVSGGARKNYEALAEAFDVLQKTIKHPISGIIPGEIGSEINAIWLSVNRNVALVDADMVGGRAVPEEQMDVHGVLGLATTPSIAVNGLGDVISVCSARNQEIFENVYRSFATSSGGYCYIAGRPMIARDVESILPSGTLSRSLRVGKALSLCTSATEVQYALHTLCGSILLGQGVITEVKAMPKAGFCAGSVFVRGSVDGRAVCEIPFQNEYLAVLADQGCLCCVPDLITLMNPATLKPVPTSAASVGVQVQVFGTPALPFWRTARAIEVLGPAHFGFPFGYSPIPSG